MNLDRLIAKTMKHLKDGRENAQSIPGLTILKRETASEIEAVVYEPVICLILQGRKETSIGDLFADLGPGDALLVSHDLPVMSRITNASPQEPYLAIFLALDLALARGLFDQLADLPAQDPYGRSLVAGRAETAWLEPLERYLDLLGNPLDAKVLGPSILREIHYRLLVSPTGAALRGFLVADSHGSRVARAIYALRRDFRSPLSIPQLAKAAGMSATSFHQHFKTVTGTTPLQYQKDLRLITARTLLAGQRKSVSQAAYEVGYESPTHFSRDYSRKFGTSPGRDSRHALVVN